jgi:hypothetical protein
LFVQKIVGQQTLGAEVIERRPTDDIAEAAPVARGGSINGFTRGKRESHSDDADVAAVTPAVETDVHCRILLAQLLREGEVVRDQLRTTRNFCL